MHGSGRHHLRIRVKRLRYALAALDEGCLPADSLFATPRFQRDLADLQSLLGTICDVDIDERLRKQFRRQRADGQARLLEKAAGAARRIGKHRRRAVLRDAARLARRMER